MKKKYERSQKIEQMGNTDEVLLEEIREYKVNHSGVRRKPVITTSAGSGLLCAWRFDIQYYNL